MTDRIAAILAAVLILCFAVDHFANDGAVALFLARKLTDFIDFLEFWR